MEEGREYLAGTVWGVEQTDDVCAPPLLIGPWELRN